MTVPRNNTSSSRICNMEVQDAERGVARITFPSSSLSSKPVPWELWLVSSTPGFSRDPQGWPPLDCTQAIRTSSPPSNKIPATQRRGQPGGTAAATQSTALFRVGPTSGRSPQSATTSSFTSETVNGTFAGDYSQESVSPHKISQMTHRI